MGSGIARVSSCEYWTLTRKSGSRNGFVTIGWEASSNCSPSTPYITNPATIRVARLDGTTWTNAGGGVDGTPTNTVGTFTTGSNTNFTAFALATVNFTDNPLPVLFDGVKAYAKK
ncbi:MAG: hypothetical protein NVV59_06930 [Chitinophagaceae bacterium]|nr:hypothetical protein [Chitinophagaceae bacterium]